jgi:hypothetical protein
MSRFDFQRISILYLIFLSNIFAISYSNNLDKMTSGKLPLDVSSSTYDFHLFDDINDVAQTNDGGFALAGSSSDFAGSTTYNVWRVLMKTDSESAIQWNISTSQTGTDIGFAVLQTQSGNLAFTGGDGEMWLYMTDMNGNYQWDNTYGNTGDDKAHDFVQTTDGGFALSGYTSIYELKNDNWQSDFILIKTDKDGNVKWNKTYGGINDEIANAIIQTSDGGYILVGTTLVRDLFDEHTDAWVVKTDPKGNLEWNMTNGGNGEDAIYSVLENEAGGYTLAGFTEQYSTDNKTDMWLISIDKDGNELWNTSYGGPGDEKIYSHIRLSEGGYLLCGTQAIRVDSDALLIKTNSFGIEQWNKTYGGEKQDVAKTVIQTYDSSYVFAGSTSVSDEDGFWSQDMWLVKVNSSGEIIWDSSFAHVITRTDYGYLPRSSGDPQAAFNRILALLASVTILIIVFSRWREQRKKRKRRTSYAKLYPKR